MFSLCIPTYQRFDKFLVNYLPKYIANEYISEIIITDEDGQDCDKIKQKFNHPKMKIYKNEKVLGPLLNKIKACSLASNQWIALIDSDNFADINYFQIATKYINEKNLSKNTILAPSWAKPSYDFRNYNNVLFNKIYFKNLSSTNIRSLSLLMNVGNYILNKHLIDNINTDEFIENAQEYSACDVIFLNTLMFEQLDLQMYIVPEMYYNHITHNGSIFINSIEKTKTTAHEVNEKFFSLAK